MCFTTILYNSPPDSIRSERAQNWNMKMKINHHGCPFMFSNANRMLQISCCVFSHNTVDFKNQHCNGSSNSNHSTKPLFHLSKNVLQINMPCCGCCGQILCSWFPRPSLSWTPFSRRSLCFRKLHNQNLRRPWHHCRHHHSNKHEEIVIAHLPPLPISRPRHHLPFLQSFPFGCIQDK